MATDDRLYFVAECPASPGFGGVVVLRSMSNARFVFFAPCCGIAWREPPLRGRLDQIHSLAELEPSGVRLPSPLEIRNEAPTLAILRDEPADPWTAYVPGLLTVIRTS